MGTEQEGEEPGPAESLRYTRASLTDIADVVDAGDADEPMLWVSWEGKPGPSIMKYAMHVIPLLLSNGAGGMHGGSPREDVPGKDGTFVQIVAYFYPSRRMASKFLRSHKFYTAVQYKDLEDAMAVATVPYGE